MKRTPLKRYTPLKSTTPLKRMSAKAKAELAVWREVKGQRINLLKSKYGYTPCEYCFKPIINGSEFYCAEGNHNNHNRRNNTLENCRILHRYCNQLIEDLNIKDVSSLINEGMLPDETQT